MPHHHQFKEVIGRSWLLSAKLARKAGYWQTAYSAILQARQNDAPFVFVQSAKLSKATGEPLKALQEVDNSLKQLENVIVDLTDGGFKAEEANAVKAKVMPRIPVCTYLKRCDCGRSLRCVLDGWASWIVKTSKAFSTSSRKVRSGYLSRSLIHLCSPSIFTLSIGGRVVGSITAAFTMHVPKV